MRAKETLCVVLPATALAHGQPTGVAFNSDTTVFLIPSNRSAQSIFGTLDATIAAWNSPTPQAVTVVNNSAGKAVYIGVAIDKNVFDKNWSARMNYPAQKN